MKKALLSGCQGQALLDLAAGEGVSARGLDDAAKNGWVLIDMKADWKTIFPPETK